MEEQDRLAALKTDLGFTGGGAGNRIDNRLTQLLQVAEKAIKAEGAATLDPSQLEDAQLVIMYAAWLWRRRDTGAGMPRMLRWSLNNRIFAEKMKQGAT